MARSRLPHLSRTSTLPPTIGLAFQLKLFLCSVGREGGQVLNAQFQRSSRDSSGTDLAYKQRAETQHSTHVCKSYCLVLGVDTAACGCRNDMQDWDFPQAPQRTPKFPGPGTGEPDGLVKWYLSMRGKGDNWHERGTQAHSGAYRREANGVCKMK